MADKNLEYSREKLSFCLSGIFHSFYCSIKNCSFLCYKRERGQQFGGNDTTTIKFYGQYNRVVRKFQQRPRRWENS